MKKLSPYIAALLVCAFALATQTRGARKASAEPDDLEQLKADVAALKETLQRQLVESPPNVPIGTILPYAGAVNTPGSIPEGWRLCNGDPMSRTDAAALFGKIGTSWGKGNGSTTFNLPDLRGRFLRGVDGGSGNDPDATARVNRDNQVVGGLVGSLQPDALQNHSHGNNPHHHPYKDKFQKDESSDNTEDRRVAHFEEMEDSRDTADVSITITDVTSIGGNSVRSSPNETRVKNAYVNWIIRVK
ncbi:MAG TPA: tail fiber protein [Pyrinomonadaceae bacterium]|nr:tail fiber protein [Pyrinomonadaceae bacterium]